MSTPTTLRRIPPWIEKFLDDTLDERFYGNIIFYVEAGRITHWDVQQSYKPPINQESQVLRKA